MWVAPHARAGQGEGAAGEPAGRVAQPERHHGRFGLLVDAVGAPLDAEAVQRGHVVVVVVDGNPAVAPVEEHETLLRHQLPRFRS